MNFFDSKYYAPVANGSKSNNTQLIDDINDARLKRGPNMTCDILSSYCVRFPMLPMYRIPESKVISEWVPVDDLTKLSRSADDLSIDNDIEWLLVRCYFHPVAEVFAYIYGRKQHGGLEDNDTLYTTSMYVPYLVDHEKAVRVLRDEGHFVRYVPKSVPKIGILVQGQHGFEISYSKLLNVSIDFENMYPGGFTKVSESILKCVNNAEMGGLIILHGEPGTGKTNYIRWLSSQAKRKMVYIPTEMTSHLTSPSFVNFLLENKGLTFILEDAEGSLKPRLGSERSIVSGILNLTDGLLGDVLRCQFICTFNTPLSNVDEALLRPGRLLVRQEFTKLSVIDSNKYLKSVDSDYIATEEMSLAELTNIMSPPVVSKKQDKVDFGFISK